MHYVFHLFADQTQFEKMTPDQQEAGMAAYMAYTQALKDAGIYVDSARLRPAAEATRVHVSADGKTSVLDGPYVDTKEQLGGYYIVDVPDLDAAISWAARCPGASHGTVEIRPQWVLPVNA